MKTARRYAARWRSRSSDTYAVGIAVQIPFLAQSLYTGPLTEELGGADISWIVGASRRTMNAGGVVTVHRLLADGP